MYNVFIYNEQQWDVESGKFHFFGGGLQRKSKVIC